MTGRSFFLAALIVILCFASLLRNNIWSDSLLLWLNVIKHSEKKLRPYINLSNSYLEKGRLDDTLRTLFKTTGMFKKEITSGNIYYLSAALEIYLNFAAVYGTKGEIDRALEFLLKAYEVDPMSARANYALGFAYMEKEDFNSAEPYLKKAIGIAEDSKAYFLYADLLERTKRQAEALAPMQRAVYLEPENVIYRNRLGLLLKAANRTAEAEQQFLAGIKLSPGLAEPYVNLGSIMYQKGQVRRAYKYYRMATEADPNSYEAWVGQGNVLDELGNRPKAVEAYKKAIATDPKRYEAYLELGIAFERAGKNKEASDAYRAALLIKPGDPGIAERLRRLGG